METVKEKDSILLSVEAMNQLSRLRDLMVTAGCKGPEIEIRLMRILIDFISQGIGIAPSKLKDSVLWQEEIPERTFPAAYTEVLAQCGELDWERISPAIFGAMFQQIMNQNRRREWGAYYTTEENILRVIRPLFLDDLEEQYRQCAGNKKRLKALLNQLGKLAFLDPACGCGNFLIIAYEKLRELEEKVIRAVWGTEGQSVDVGAYRQVTPAQFYGIEYEPFQAEIARLGLWMADIQMNGRLLQEDGHQSIPESGQATIVCADALTADWN